MKKFKVWLSNMGNTVASHVFTLEDMELTEDQWHALTLAEQRWELKNMAYSLVEVDYEEV